MSLHKRASCCYRPLLFVLLAALVCAPSAFAQNQCVQKISELPAAPELIGFRLGMSKEEIKARVPQTVFGRTDDFGVSKTTINPYFDPRIDRTKFESVRSISLDLLDDHITSLWIGYDETYKVQSIDDFVRLVSQSLHVPERWSPWKSRGQQLRCADFQLIVTTLAGGPSLRLLDLAAEDKVALRRQAKEERESMAEAATSDGESEPEEITGDKQTKTYFTATCHPEKVIDEARRILFKTAEEAEKAGFKLAKDCH